MQAAAAFPTVLTAMWSRYGCMFQPPHPHKTERRVYLPQAEAAVTRRIKYHFTLSSVSHNRVKKWKKGRRKEGCLCRSSHWPLLLHSLCVSEKMVHWLLTIKKKHRGEEKKNTIFFRRCSLPQLLHERNRKKAVKFWPRLLLCVCINIQFLCFHPEEVKHRGRVMA